MFKFMKPKPKTTAEEKLEKIIDILFPPLKSHVDKDGNKFQIDYSVDMNLDAALTDLEEGYNDETCRSTIKKVSNRLFEVRKIINVYRSLDSDTKYLLVDDMNNDDLENIPVEDNLAIDKVSGR
jgi:hypothetical protein